MNIGYETPSRGDQWPQPGPAQPSPAKLPVSIPTRRMYCNHECHHRARCETYVLVSQVVLMAVESQPGRKPGRLVGRLTTKPKTT